MMKSSTTKGGGSSSKIRSLRLILSHICAFAVGALLMLQWNFWIVIDNQQQQNQNNNNDHQRSSTILVAHNHHHNDPSKSTATTRTESRERSVVECDDNNNKKPISSTSSSSNKSTRNVLESSLLQSSKNQHHDDSNAKDSPQSSASSSSSFQQKQQQPQPHQKKKYDLLPILIMENVPTKNAHNVQKLLLDSKLRISLKPAVNNKNTTLSSSVSSSPMISIGPYYGFYRSDKHKEMMNWITNNEQTTPNLLRDTSFIKYEMVEDTNSKRDILFSLKFWKRIEELTHKVLILDFASVLCGTPTNPILSYLQWDWIGAAWKWASNPKSPHHFGGNGAYSIRNPKYLVAILQQQNITSNKSPKNAGNEDMWYVRLLNEWMIKGDIRNNGGLLQPPKLAPYKIQQEFAVEEIVSPSGITPTGVYHLMRTVDYKDRDNLIQKCPEIKSLYTPLHEAKCALLRCPKNMSMNYWVMKDLEKQEKSQGKKEGSLVEKCDIHYHPVAATYGSTDNTSATIPT